MSLSLLLAAPTDTKYLWVIVASMTFLLCMAQASGIYASWDKDNLNMEIFLPTLVVYNIATVQSSQTSRLIGLKLMDPKVVGITLGAIAFVTDLTVLCLSYIYSYSYDIYGSKGPLAIGLFANFISFMVLLILGMQGKLAGIEDHQELSRSVHKKEKGRLMSVQEELTDNEEILEN